MIKIENNENELDYRDKPGYMQCSFCDTYYSFNEYLKLKSVWVDPKQKQYGKTAVCKCGADTNLHWSIQSKKDQYLISTTHLGIGHNSVTDWTDLNSDFFYETMIFKVEGKTFPFDKFESLDFQMRYKTREEAILGHHDTYDKLENILLDPTKYPMGVIPMFCNLWKAAEDQRKTIQSSVKERLK